MVKYLKDASRRSRRYDSNDWPSLEVRIKSLNYVGDLLLEQIQRFHERGSILERYFTGDLSCHHHGTEAPYCAMTTVINAGLDNNESQMFIPIRKHLKMSSPFAAVTRLQSLERCLVSGSQSMQPHLLTLFRGRLGRGNMATPALFRGFDEKLRATANLSRIQIEKLIDEVIQGPPEIVESVSPMRMARIGGASI